MKAPLHIPITLVRWFPQFSSSLPGSNAPRSCTLFTPEIMIFILFGVILISKSQCHSGSWHHIENKMLHSSILNPTQLTNEMSFSYSFGITELMSFISFQTFFVSEILPLTFVNGNHDSRYTLCRVGIYWRDITCSYYIMVSAAIWDTSLNLEVKIIPKHIKNHFLCFRITMLKGARNATYLPFWLTSNENVSLLNHRLKSKHCP